MTDGEPTHQKKHLARNVPRDFNLCLERERVRLEGLGMRSGRRKDGFASTLKYLSEGAITQSDHERLSKELHEIRLRYLVISKTLDERVPPTEIMKQLRSLKARADLATRTLKDEDRDATVRRTMDLEDGEDIPGTDYAFQNANTLAERAAIANRIISQFASYLTQMSEFFDYKADLFPKGNQTSFGMIYVVNALGAMFERENQLGCSPTISKNVSPRNSEGDDEFKFTGPFLYMLTEFINTVDDSQLSNLETTSFRDRVRRLSMHRKKDAELYMVLEGSVSIEDMLDFMKRAEAIR